mgnify:CR=1 FL=1
MLTGIFEKFRNQNPITKWWKDYLCGFVPFQTGTYTINLSGSNYNSYDVSYIHYNVVINCKK